MEIGSKLRRARAETGLTQEQAAELLGVSRQTVSNWENNKSYPDIISVIKMSDIYHVSLDHLLKEEASVKQTYQAFLEESTNTVKAKRNLGKIILLSAFFSIWFISLIIFWLAKEPVPTGLGFAFRWILLPLLLLAATVTVARNDYWGKGNWFCVPAAALAFVTIPYTEWTEAIGVATYTFRFPDLPYMAAGILIAAIGLLAGAFWRKALIAKEEA